ncbi:hybrid sensor histidine kinase/response regulator [Stutzerimonas stutzeri]|uniref:hybrid sensor histidine kinase/response regulator n=1 Tax=Stutzerimonas stutzeri TaxID=316 RepID=UPI0004B7F73F|nr:ATP-binding protein [Stutzerimonas stutzeri]MCQ4331535.1 ATP-binding protein [Stutzerimonas stutzeri]
MDVCKDEHFELPVAQVIEDRSGALSLARVLARFESGSGAQAGLPPAGYTHSAFWLRLELNNGGSSTCSRWLTVGAPRLEDVRVYKMVPGGWKSMRAGSLYPLQEWSYPARQPLFPVSMPAGESVVLIVRVASGTQMLINPELWSDLARFQHRQSTDLWDGITLGIVCLVALFSLMIGAIFRSCLVVVHAFAVSSYILLTCVLNGYLVLWPAALSWTRELTVLASVVSFACFLGYAAVVLRVSQLPRVIGVLFGLQFVAHAGARLWTLIDPVQGGDAALMMMKGIYLLFPLTLLVGWRRGVRYDWLAWLLPLLFMLLLAARYFLELSGIPWQSPEQRFSLSSTLPGVLLLLCTLAVEVSRARSREKRALLDLDHLKQAEHERLEQTVALRTEQLRESLRARSGLIARISHDLRSPLVSVINYARLLQTGPVHDYPQKIERNTRRQLELIDDLLEFSSGELQQMELSLAPGYLYGFLREVEDEAAFLATRQHNAFDARFAQDLPMLVHADFRRLRQVLINLLANAAKFTTEGHIRFEVSCVDSHHPKVQLRFCVADSGIGLDPKDREQLMRPFGRGRNAQQYEGSGLGLSIVQELLQRMDSELKIEAPAEGGTRVSFTVQLACATEQDIDFTASNGPLTAVDGAGRHVLLVDDVEQNVEWLADLLGGYGFEISTATSAAQAIACLSDDPVDLIVTDQMMPDLDGWEFLRQVRSAWPKVPVVLYSAAPAQRPSGYPEHLEFDNVLIKPASNSDMLLCIDERACFKPQTTIGEVGA